MNDEEKWLSSLGQSTAYYPSNIPHFDTINRIVRAWFGQTSSFVSLMREQLKALNGSLDVGLLDSPLIEGYCRAGHDEATGERSSLAQISLGIFPKVLGLANRAHVARLFGSHQQFVKEDFGSWSIKDVCVGVLTLGGPGHVDRDTYNSVYDCATLALLHEIAHCQEPFADPSSQLESRAIEACADEGSGYLFVRMMQSRVLPGSRLDESDAVHRLADASFFLSALVHWASQGGGQQDMYHHPWTRMRCFMRGACFALYGADRARWKKAFEVAWHRQTEYSIAIAAFTTGELWFWNAADVLSADWRRFLDETYPFVNERRNQLPDGFLLTPLTRGMKWIEHLG
ncbi:MAG: hypothetical protein ACT6UH_04190 [Hydrogenophaga sp.]|uniref:hypothetical protein n=1 Tax=Hydrogenophaga sp. TaxID=1904254 RepID=UPI004035C1EE